MKMSTKLKIGEINSLKKQKAQKRERQRARKRALGKKRRVTQQVRISSYISTRLKDYARSEKRTMSKIADEFIRDGLKQYAPKPVHKKPKTDTIASLLT